MISTNYIPYSVRLAIACEAISFALLAHKPGIYLLFLGAVTACTRNNSTAVFLY